MIDQNVRVSGMMCRDQVVGRNCRFLQGPGTDPEQVKRLREGIAAGGPVTVRMHAQFRTRILQHAMRGNCHMCCEIDSHTCWHGV